MWLVKDGKGNSKGPQPLETRKQLDTISNMLLRQGGTQANRSCLCPNCAPTQASLDLCVPLDQYSPPSGEQGLEVGLAPFLVGFGQIMFHTRSLPRPTVSVPQARKTAHDTRIWVK